MGKETNQEGIDAPVRALVEAINTLPAVDTFSSCGGHREITNVSQVGEGEFYVCFDVDQLDAGAALRSLSLLAFAAGEFEDVTLSAWHNDLEFVPEALAFEIRGDGATTADELAAIVRAVRERAG